MILSLDETIVAVASAAGAGARAIVRLSGSQAIGICTQVFHFELPQIQLDLNQKHKDIGSRRDPRFALAQEAIWQHDLISNRVIVYTWPNDRSYTRQPVAEIHGLLSPVDLDELVVALTTAGARLAAPGEFTLRAFSAGRMDLLQAEAVLGVIDAENQKNLGTALRQMAGGMSNAVQNIRSELLNILADLEAGLDFVDEDIEFISQAEVLRRLDLAKSHLQEMLDQMSARSSAGELPRVVLQGLPNAGKSQLFNALSTANAAIVSPIAGTTRDYLSSVCNIDALQFELVDTAGVEDAFDSGISHAAQEMTSQQQREATLTLLCCDLSQPLNDWTRSRIAQTVNDSATLLIGTKSDLSPVWNPFPKMILASTVNENGLDRLRQAIHERLHSTTSTEMIASTAARCSDSFRLTITTLDHVTGLVAKQAGDELISSELRVALQELGMIAGQVYTDDLLDRIFSRFCIGK